jgi:muramoyltetrapeptide carboxypeptidase LdcA involved in peptidoglycan recycling
MIKPQKLKSGDTVATVSTSWGGPSVFPHRYQAGIDQLETEFGVHVIAMPNALRDAAWLARHPKARADDLMQAFADPSIRGIIATIGGEDSIRLLPYLDLKVIRNNPKIFLGYSDSTVSHMACYKAGLGSFYGPSIMSGFAENGGMFSYMVDSIKQTLFSSKPIGEIKHNLSGWTAEVLDWGKPANQLCNRKRTISSGWKYLQGKGKHQGHLLGGCIEVLDWLRGTEYWPCLDQWQKAILFIETSEDAPPPAMVRYTLRAMAAIGILKRLTGILFGRPGGGIDQDKFVEYDQAILQVVRDEEGLSDLPVVTNMDFGHTDPMFILPYGLQAEIDCNKQRINILENAVTE